MASKSHGGTPPADAVTGQAGDQPGSIPHMNGDPTLGDLPTSEGTPVSLLYFDTSTGVYKVATPDGTGTVVTNQFLDVSADVTVSNLDVTGLL